MDFKALLDAGYGYDVNQQVTVTAKTVHWTTLGTTSEGALEALRIALESQDDNPFAGFIVGMVTTTAQRHQKELRIATLTTARPSMADMIRSDADPFTTDLTITLKAGAFVGLFAILDEIVKTMVDNPDETLAMGLGQKITGMFDARDAFAPQVALITNNKEN